MRKGLVRVIIPSRSERFLQKTIDELLDKARGDIEIIVVLDGYWPETMVNDDQRVIVMHHGGQHKNFGMRESINLGVKASNGEFIMKTDEHCAFGEGFDIILAADCKHNWVATPCRLKLDDKEWTYSRGKYPSIDNMYLTCPINGSVGLSGKEWRSWHSFRKKIKIDDCMMFQGSCYFMTREHWDWMGGLDTEKYGKFHFEPQEIVLKTWLGGGRVITNKNTWYAHRYRKKGEGRGYGFCNIQHRELDQGKLGLNMFLTDYWINNRWKERVYDFEWLIEKFWPVPNWPENWREEVIKNKVEHEG